MRVWWRLLATYQFLQTRRSGRDCRNPVAMDGCLGHFRVVWIPAIRAGMTALWDSRLKPIGGEVATHSACTDGAIAVCRRGCQLKSPTA